MNAKVGKPVVVADFNGTLAGAGASFTTMTCTDDFNYELWESLGSPGSPPPPFPRVSVNGSTMKTAPVLIQFYKTPLVPGEDPAARANRIEIRAEKGVRTLYSVYPCDPDQSYTRVSVLPFL
jgi:hypothetical protein